MSGIGEAAAIIGITSFAVQNIKDLHNFIQNVRDVEQLENVRSEISSLQSQLSGLDFLAQADAKTLDEVKNTGVTQAINSCGDACAKFQKQLSTWVKHGPESVRDRIRLARNKAKIERLQSQMWTAARLLESAVGILTLKTVWKDRSESDQTAELEKLKHKVSAWKAVATQQLAGAQSRAFSLSEVDNDDSEEAAEETEEQVAVLDSFVKACDKTAEQLQSIKLNQEITNIRTGKGANAQVGMPAAVVDKVAKQKIDNVTTEEYGKSQVGIW